MKKIKRSIFLFVICGLILSACTNPKASKVSTFPLEDGEYMVDFDTDSSMFHVHELCEGKARLTVSEGKALLHLVMPSKNVLNLFLGMAEDAKKDGADLIVPEVETIWYSEDDGEEVFSFDVPVTVYDEEFNLALVGKKEVWYDHKVKISNALPASGTESSQAKENVSATKGTYQVQVSLEGGTGKASIQSPTKLEKTDEGYTVTIVWSSKYYDYMIVDGQKYFPVETGENSVFEIPVKDISKPINVIADTVAMSTPHEIEYVINFESDSVQ